MFIHVSKAKILVNKGAVIVDIRSPVEFAKGSISNAVNITLRNISQLLKFDKSKTIIFISSEDSDSELEIANNYALQMGFNSFQCGSIKNWEQQPK